MPTGILQAIFSAISGIFSAINNIFGAKNTKEMKDRQEAQKEVTYQSEIEKNIKEKNLEEIRKRISS
jgi:Na+-translocating ferredoxin:NAD+ oxidoreductase RnfG subunit